MNRKNATSMCASTCPTIVRDRIITAEIFLHSDHGVQFASAGFRDALTIAGIGQRMCRRGDCRDNAPCESWFGKLKTEWIYPHGVYATRNEAALAIVEYIEMIYNGDRVHQVLAELLRWWHWQTPNEVETKYYDEQFALTAMSK